MLIILQQNHYNTEVIRLLNQDIQLIEKDSKRLSDD